MISIGDCKVYRLNSNSGEITDLTFGSRLNLLNPSDCGGRVGPISGEGEPIPDLRNLKLNFVECNKGDLLWVVSDGVHDNIDPQWMGLMPKDMGHPTLAEVEGWGHDILNNDQDLLARVKNDFSMNLLKILLSRGGKAKEMMRAYQNKNKKKNNNSEGEKGTKDLLGSDDEDEDDEEEQTSALDLLNRYFMTEGETDYSIYSLSSRRVKTRIRRKPTISGEKEMEKEKGGDNNSHNNSNTTTTTTTPSSEGTNSHAAEMETVVLSVLQDSSGAVETQGGVEEEGEGNDEGISHRTVTQALIKHAIKVTRATRTFMETNPTQRQPEDLLSYPGKMDHTTCVSFRV